jgi:acyl-CoA thioester hydrolase
VHRERVRFGDLDANRHLNNVVYLRYFETARILFMRELWPDHDPAESGKAMGMIFAECHINYRAPGVYQDDVRTYIWVDEIKRSSVRLGFEMVVDARDQTIAEGWGTIVGYDYDHGKARPIPDELRARLEDASR